MRLPASVAWFALIALPVAAQVRGIPPSVTSLGGSHSPGIPASVTSINNRPFCCATTAFPDTVFQLGTSFGRHPRFRIDARFGRPVFQPVFIEVPVAVPVQVPVIMVPVGDPNAEVVDDTPRRVVRRRIVEEDSADDAGSHARNAPAPQPQPALEAKPLPATVLVFRDGHRVEVRDYAISGDTFYDLSNGLTKKIRLADLDLEATAKVNDERGVPFSVPATPRPSL